MNTTSPARRDVSPTRFPKTSPHYFAAIVGGGLTACLLVFLAVQAAPLFGWMLWIIALMAAGAGASYWYRTESAKARRIEEETRNATRQRETEKSKAELRRQRGLRRAELMEKYAGDHNLVERIVQGTYWDGQTAGQLKDALGNPPDIAAKVLRKKRQEIWKFHPTGGNRYALWITLEEDLVVRWEEHA